MTWDELFLRIGEGVFLLGATIGSLLMFLFLLACIVWVFDRKK